MKLGLVVPATTDGAEFLTVPKIDLMGYAFNATTWTGAGGLNEPATIETAIVNANATILNIPILVGPQTGTPLTNSGSGETTSPQSPTNTNTPTTMTMTDVANGVWDEMFTTCFTVINNYRPTCILRIGWELYGNGWFPWCGAALTAEHTAAFQHLVTLARTVSSSFQFDWNGAQNYTGYDPMTTEGAYPGNSYVDYISADWYDGLGTGTSKGGGAAGFNAAASAYLAEGLAFAIANGKPFCIPELGLGLTTYNTGSDLPDDDPYWIQAAYEWARANETNLGYINFFQDEVGSWSGALGSNNPQSTAVFTQLLGAWARELQGQSSYRFVTAGSNRLRA